MGLHIISDMTSHTEGFNKLFRPLNNGPERYFSASSCFFFVTEHTMAASDLGNRRNMQNVIFCFKTFSTIVWF